MKTIVLAGVLLACAPARAQGVDLPSWESQVLGTLFGTFCGYFADRVTPVGKQVNVASFAQCKQRFDQFYPPCIQRIKAEGRYHVGSSAEGAQLGQELGACIGGAYNRAAQPKPR